MYGMPQPNAYGQYGFGGANYGGFPNGQGTVAAGGAGMPQPNPLQAGAGMTLGGQGAGDNAMQGNQAPGQWGASDPNAFYQQQQQQYWGGKLVNP
jgi:nucleolysin TIA-1/TIAR